MQLTTLRSGGSSGGPPCPSPTARRRRATPVAWNRCDPMSSAPWLTETIRFSAFGDTPAYKSSLLLDLFGVQPDQVNERPAQSFRQEVARHGRFRIIATRNPGRLDVVFADLADANVSDPTKSDYKPFLEIGDYDEIFPRFNRSFDAFFLTSRGAHDLPMRQPS